MVNRMIRGVLSASVLFFHTSSALVARGASTSTSSSFLAIATTNYPGSATATGFPGVVRDNGGGGKLNGHNVIVFGDTQTPKDGPMGYSWYANFYSKCFLLWTSLLVARHVPRNIRLSNRSRPSHCSALCLKERMLNQTSF